MLVSDFRLTLEPAVSQLSQRIASSVERLVMSSVYRPEVTLKELNTAQAFLLALFGGLMTQDTAVCSLLLAVEPQVDQLPSRYLQSWLSEDFQFQKEDVQKVLHALNDTSLEFPKYIERLFTELEFKYVFDSCSDSEENSTASTELEQENETPISFIKRCLGLNPDASDQEVVLASSEIDKDGFTLLLCLSDKGYLETVEELLRLGVPWNQKGHNGVTGLHCASASGEVPILEAFLKAGADVNVTSRDGETPLHLAVSCGHADVVKFLLDNGADISADNKIRQTPVHVAAANGHEDIIQMLLGQLSFQRRLQGLRLGAVSKDLGPVNWQDSYGCTPLHLAARANSAFCCRELVAHGAHLNVLNNREMSALNEASVNDGLEAQEVLLEHGAIGEFICKKPSVI